MPRVKGIERECAWCREVFVALHDHKTYTQLFCSRKCGYEAKLDKRPRLKCRVCGKELAIRPSRMGRGQKYCSPECYHADPAVERGPKEAKSNEWSTSRRGNGNPNFKGGLYGNRARRSKFSLKVKGEECCRVCETNRELHLHHMVPRSKAIKGRDDINNGMPLCNSCHMSWHRRGIAIPRELMTEVEWECVSSLATPGWLDERYPETGAESAEQARRFIREEREARA